MSMMGGLDALMGGGDAGGGGSPEELLAQIADLMQQYLAMGPDTPAFDAVQAALPEIEAAAGGGGDMGAMPAPEDGGAPPPDMMSQSPMEEGLESGPPPEADPNNTDFGAASDGAMEFLKRKKTKA